MLHYWGTPPHHLRLPHTTARRASAGFSLVELIISIAIIALITGVILARYGSFNSTVLLTSLAYDVALSIREAQVLGISVRSDAGVFSDAYGMHFTEGTTYLLFIDSDDSGDYDDGEEISSYTIGQNNAIIDLCANSACERDSLDVLFRRPEPDAIIAADPSVSTIDSARVIVGSADGKTRTVRVWPTGQIAVEE